MMVASTNADLPDQVVGTYAYSRTFGVLWLGFYMSTNLIGLNLVLAVVYNEYADSLKASVVSFLYFILYTVYCILYTVYFILYTLYLLKARVVSFFRLRAEGVSAAPPRAHQSTGK